MIPWFPVDVSLVFMLKLIRGNLQGYFGETCVVHISVCGICLLNPAVRVYQDAPHPGHRFTPVCVVWATATAWATRGWRQRSSAIALAHISNRLLEHQPIHQSGDAPRMDTEDSVHLSDSPKSQSHQSSKNTLHTFHTFPDTQAASRKHVERPFLS